MKEIDEIFSQVDFEIDRLAYKFIEKYIPASPEHSPSDFEHDVKAFCVLAHAAFEAFIEQVSLLMMSSTIDGWYNSRNYTESLLTMALYYKQSIAVDDNEENQQERIFDILRVVVDNVKRLHSHAISENHGFSVRYLRKMLILVGINVPQDGAIINAVQRLAAMRGSFAHEFAPHAAYRDRKTRMRRPIVPEDALATVMDCVRLCDFVADAAASKFPR